MTNYQSWAQTLDRDSYADVTARLANDNTARLMHASMGISGESGELLDAIKKHILYGKTLDVENIKEEAGDICWYMALLLETLGSSFEEVMELNREKLSKRYPNGSFSEIAAITRADKV